MDVQRAIAHVDGPIATALRGRGALDQAGIEPPLGALDGTPNQAGRGGQAPVGGSPARARSAAAPGLAAGVAASAAGRG